MKTRTVFTLFACLLTAALAITLTESLTRASTPNTSINGLGTIEVGKTAALFFSGDGNPPCHYPGLDFVVGMINQQEARKTAIRHWQTQTEYPLTDQERRWLTNSLAEVDGLMHDLIQFSGPYILTVGPPPQ